jgi:hypothetical protein
VATGKTRDMSGMRASDMGADGIFTCKCEWHVNTPYIHIGPGVSFGGRLAFRLYIF